MSYPVSLAGLPDLAKLLPSDIQPSAQPTTDFLAILDKALDDRGGTYQVSESSPSPYDYNSRNAPVNKSPEAQTPGFETTRRDAAADKTAQTAVGTSAQDPAEESTRIAKDRETAKDREIAGERGAARSKEAKDAKENQELGSAYLKKHRERDEDGVRRLVPHADQKYQNGLENIGQAAVRLVSESNHIRNGENPGTRSNKIEHKSTQSAARESQANQLATLKGKSEVRQNADLATDAKSLSGDASKKLPDWSSLDGKVHGLKDAMSTVQNLAQRLGLSDSGALASAQVASAAKAEQNSRVAVTNSAIRYEKKSAEGVESTSDTKNKRLEQARTERIRGLDLSKVEVADHRGLAGKSSLVLENMTATDNASKSSILVSAQQQGQPQVKGDEGAGKRDQLSLVNTAFFTPAGPMVQMPVTVVPAANGSYQQSIKQWLETKGNNDIVQQAKIVLNGNDSGEIRLILKPENLGEVRINLQLEDGRIGGSIFVENKDVQSAFESNLAELRQAFEDSGLQTGNLNVNVDGKGSGSGGNFAKRDTDDERHNRYAAQKIESHIASVGDYATDYERVNLMA